MMYEPLSHLWSAQVLFMSGRRAMTQAQIAAYSADRAKGFIAKAAG